MERGRPNGGATKRRITNNNCAWNIFSIAINISQAAATIEGIVADAGNTTSDGDGVQPIATREGRAANAGHATSDGDGGQAAAITEGLNAEAGHALRDGDRSQAAATTEGIVADADHAIAKNIFFNLISKDCFHRRILISCCRDDIIAFQSHRGQTGATREGIAADAGHALGDGNGGQVGASIEGRAADACHALGDGDGGQAAAITEFITYCVPICFD